MKSIVLLSGGLDSTVCFRKAVDAHEPQLALFFDYGQLAAEREGQAAAALAERLAVPFERLALPWLRERTHSALVDSTQPLPVLTERDLETGSEATSRSARQVWVPNRNAVFIHIAAAYAESLQIGKIIAGFNAEEATTFRDNSMAFVAAINDSLEYSTQIGVQVEAPTGSMTKREILVMGKQINAPLDLIWPCYRGGRKICWACESCLRLKRALEQEGLVDWFRALSDRYR